MKRSLRRQAIRYVIVGSAVDGIDIGLFVVLMALIPQNRYLEANTVATAVSA